MTESNYLIVGAEESPYSVKVRSYFRYKNIPHTWKTRAESAELFAQHAKLPLIPLVVTPDSTGIQDSTPIIERMEATIPEPSIHPAEPVCRFVSILLEEFGDEWGNKWMFHLRWAREIDQIGCARRIAAMVNPNADEDQIAKASQSIRERMVGRVWFVGSNETTAPLIEASFQDSLKLLDQHLESRRYLFGDRPSFADFGLWGQIYNANRDHTPAQIISKTRNIQAWLDRMLNPISLGPFDEWSSLSSTLSPLLATQVGSMFLRWSDANSRAIDSGQNEFSVELSVGEWTQRPQKYHAKSLAALREKYRSFSEHEKLRELLLETECLQYLQEA
ncbi:MAG: glutathione S-transferase family protein [Gammaproteobacteria bacterium]|nr:glutathione S-transferase family protein [Gammaproteobacteria bacterium]MYD80293.1 glutathione S-transferase family protein [Gammaproteobacteria bacterium]